MRTATEKGPQVYRSTHMVSKPYVLNMWSLFMDFDAQGGHV